MDLRLRRRPALSLGGGRHLPGRAVLEHQLARDALQLPCGRLHRGDGALRSGRIPAAGRAAPLHPRRHGPAAVPAHPRASRVPVLRSPVTARRVHRGIAHASVHEAARRARVRLRADRAVRADRGHHHDARPRGSRDPPGFGRQARSRHRPPDHRRRRPRAAARRGRRDRRLVTFRDERISQPPRGDRRGHLARPVWAAVAAHRRHRAPRHGWLPVSRRPQEGHDPVRRAEHLSGRHRGRAEDA